MFQSQYRALQGLAASVSYVWAKNTGNIAISEHVKLGTYTSSTVNMFFSVREKVKCQATTDLLYQKW